MLSRREVIVGGALAAAAAVAGQEAQAATGPVMREAALTLLDRLSTEQKAKAHLPFHSDERFAWHYVPMDRNGLAYKEMSASQRRAAAALLATGLSQPGLRKVEAIRQMELVLHAMENGSGPTRDPDLYYFTVFGEPAGKGAWGWRYEGHHVSLHWTVLNGSIIASTPQFLGSNPAQLRSGPDAGARILGAEEEIGRAIVKSLDAEQRRAAILSETAPSDIVSAALRKAAILEDRGVAYGQLAQNQQGLLITLLEEYARVQNEEISAKRMQAVRKAGLASLKFAWMGGTERGQPHYYRIQGKTFLVEYDNTQNDANHVHTVWRDFNGDFGEDLLARHYHTAAHDHGHD